MLRHRPRDEWARGPSAQPDSRGRGYEALRPHPSRQPICRSRARPCSKFGRERQAGTIVAERHRHILDDLGVEETHGWRPRETHDPRLSGALLNFPGVPACRMRPVSMTTTRSAILWPPFGGHLPICCIARILACSRCSHISFLDSRASPFLTASRITWCSS